MINENAQNDFAGRIETNVAERPAGLRRSVGFYGLMFVSLGSISDQAGCWERSTLRKLPALPRSCPGFSRPACWRYSP